MDINDEMKAEKFVNLKSDLEDGEISDEAPNPNERPLCIPFLRGRCRYGSYCRFRHLGSISLGNYSMFDRVNLSVNTSRVINDDVHMVEPKPSFDMELRRLKILMSNAGPKYSSNNRQAYVKLSRKRRVQYTIKADSSSSSSSSSDYTSTTTSSSDSEDPPPKFKSKWEGSASRQSSKRITSRRMLSTNKFRKTN